MPINGKPKKRDFTDMREFLRAAAAWANENMNEWPWGGLKDEDDEYYFMAISQERPMPKCPQDHTPNAETIAAIKEIEDGGGETFHGTVEEAIAAILSEDNQQ